MYISNGRIKVKKNAYLRKYTWKLQKDQRIEKIKYSVKRSRFKIHKFIRYGIKILSYKFFADIFVTEKFIIFDYLFLLIQIQLQIQIQLKKVLIFDKQSRGN